MSARAIVLGLLLGLTISAVTYFNDFVIYQTMLIGNHLPIAVFGTALLLLLLVNPALGLLNRDWPLRRGELAVVVAIGLAACAWPGSGFYRGFSTVTAMPAHWVRVEASWRGSDVMAYLPGGGPQLAPGHVRDWPGLVEQLRDADDPDAPADRRAIVERLRPQTRQWLADVDTAAGVGPLDRDALLDRLNSELIVPDAGAAGRADAPAEGLAVQLAGADLLPDAAEPAMRLRHEALQRAEAEAAAQAAIDDGRDAGTASATAAERVRRREATRWEHRANRAALAGAFADVLVDTPHAEGLLVAGGEADPDVLDAFIEGRPGFDMASVPWGAWWPTFRLWGGLALIMAGAAIAMALIVHPQWSQRELLPYPLARFVEEIAERRPHAWLPDIARQPGFWYAVVGLVALHTVNGLHAWYPNVVPQIPRALDFNALRELLPNASRVYGSHAYFHPTIYLTVVAFTFFLSSSVGFSLGISHLLFIVLGVGMISYGTNLDQSYITGDTGNLLRFGAYLGVAAIVIYTGRWYYMQVAASAVGVKRWRGQVPGYSVWAARALVVTVVLAVIWTRQAGLDWLLASAFVGMVLLTFLVMTRVVVETGIFFLQAWWMPVGVLTALFGMEAIGPSAYLGLALASVLIVGDPRETLMPYLSNGLKMADHPGGASPQRLAPWLAVIVLAGFIVAGAMTMTLQYQHGVAGTDGWMRQMLPSMPFTEGARHIVELGATDRLSESMEVTGMNRLATARPVPGAIPWTLVGLGLVLVAAAARLRLPWWPLHPVAFVLWGTNPMITFAMSFLIGWMIKASVVNVAGTRGYHAVKPIMIGIIAGELFMAIIWMTLGAGYYFNTGITPVQYRIFPG